MKADTRKESLPIDEHLPAITAAMRAAGNHVLVAEPGAGKTTRLPAALLDAGFAQEGEILVLEPRRLAARLAARRVASERGTKLGGEVGYRVRFDDRTSKDTKLVFMTEGILTRRLAQEPTLKGVAAVVLDEFHERHLDGDLVLAWLRRLQSGGHPLHIVVMSATLDAEPLSDFLDAPLTRVPGRTHPVEVEYQDGVSELPLPKRVVAGVRRLAKGGLTGDILVFLPGAAEIRRSREALEPLEKPLGFDTAVLHGDLPLQEQEKVVRLQERPRVILSTNVAESSLTLPGVVAVVDSGLARMARHSPWSGLPSLSTEKVSQASAIQRMGRAGRLGPGRCIRLFSEHDFRTRPAHEPPAILRADLVPVSLLLRAHGDDPYRFPFLQSPPQEALDAAHVLLRALGAIEEDGHLTPVGEAMLRLPVHPRQARLALAAQEHGAAARGCLLAALMGERDIRQEMRTRFDGRGRDRGEVGASDLVAQLERFEAAEFEGGGRAAWRRHGLDALSTQAVQRVFQQLSRSLGIPREPENALVDEEEALLLATLRAFPDRVGRRREPRGAKVVFAAGGAAQQAEGSVVREAEFVVGVDVGEVSGRGRVLRAASQIEPEWLLDLFPDQIEEQREMSFDVGAEQVVGRTRLQYGALVLDEGLDRHPRGAQAEEVLIDAAMEVGAASFFGGESFEVLRGRAAFAQQHGGPELQLDEGRLREVLAQAAEGCRGFAELRANAPLSLLEQRLGRESIGALDRFAPSTLKLGMSRATRVHYEAGKDPWIASRLQDFFGLADGPSIAGGRVPLVLHLLAPNGRAVQVTTDLKGFWQNHYPTLRRSLMRRYSRHAWPEDPVQARPTRGGLKPRRQGEK